MPSPFEALLLALAAWRVWHLLAHDDLTEPVRRHVTDGRDKLLEFIQCPYCLAAWVAGAWVVAFAVWPEGTMWAALVFAVATAPVILNHMLSG